MGYWLANVSKIFSRFYWNSAFRFYAINAFKIYAMKIKDTYIIKIRSQFVKLHQCVDTDSHHKSTQYFFIEFQDGTIVQITYTDALEYIKIKQSVDCD